MSIKNFLQEVKNTLEAYDKATNNLTTDEKIELTRTLVTGIDLQIFGTDDVDALRKEEHDNEIRSKRMNK